jgi:transglutaminase-like putative cysteine protease
MLRKSVSLLLGTMCVCALTMGQDKSPARFGRVSPEDFKTTRYELDTSAGAAIIADIGSSAFESGNEWFIQVFKHYKRVHILKKSGYDEANVSIYLYMDGTDEERVTNLKAVTYNLENGKVVETKLESKAVFTDKLDKHNIVKKFTLPAVKEGSIIEYSYTINSEFPYRLRPWAFQDGNFPVLWSEYEISLPEYYEYIFLSQGYNPFHIKDSENSRQTFNFRMTAPGAYGGGSQRSEAVSVTPGITRHRWVVKDVAPLKEENFVTTLGNHINYIEFQLSALRFPDSPVRPVMSTWAKMTEDLLKDDQYGGQLAKSNNFFSDKVEELTKGTTNLKDKAVNIYNWVRDNFTCTDYSAFYAEQTLKATFTKKSGSVAEVNLLLVAMLRHAGLDATPVLLSSRSHGKVYPLYPIRSKFNYTIVNLKIDDQEYNMDATRPFLGFGKLHTSSYNGHARKINEEATAMSFEADSLKEQSVTGIFIAGNNKGQLTGHFQQQATYFESYELRSKVKEKGEEAYFKDLAKGFMSDIDLKNGKLDHLQDYTKPVIVDYDFTLNESDEGGMIYLNPMLSQALKANPFKSAERKYPVEMPYVPDVNYTLSMQLPEGYTVEDMPKSTIVNYNDGEGVFQYIIGKQDNMLQFRCRVKLGRAQYAPEEYEHLRSFFDMIVKKQAEQIVIKKKS